MGDQDFNSAHGLGNMSRRERDEVYKRAQGRINDPYSMLRQRFGAYPTMGNFYAAEDARDRCRRRNTGVDEVSDHMARMGLGRGGSRDPRSGRGIYWQDQYAAPEPPRMHPRNVEYYLNRASRPQNGYQDNFNDAYQYMYGCQPDHRRTAPVGGLHDPRKYAGLNLRFGLNGGRNRDPATSRWDRVRNWF